MTSTIHRSGDRTSPKRPSTRSKREIATSWLQHSSPIELSFLDDICAPPLALHETSRRAAAFSLNSSLLK